MKKMIEIFFLVVCCVSWSFAQQKVPEGLIKAMKDYLSNEDLVNSDVRCFKLDTLIEISEIEPSIPVEIYMFKESGKRGFIDSIDDNASVKSIIKPTGRWRFYLKARGKYVYQVEFDGASSIWQYCGSGNSLGNQAAWLELRESYQESLGVNPIILLFGREQFIHFPQINDHNLTRLMSKEYRNELLEKFNINKKSSQAENSFAKDDIEEMHDEISVITHSYASLVDSRNAIKYFKNTRKRNREQKQRMIEGDK